MSIYQAWNKTINNNLYPYHTQIEMYYSNLIIPFYGDTLDPYFSFMYDIKLFTLLTIHP